MKEISLRFGNPEKHSKQKKKEAALRNVCSSSISSVVAHTHTYTEKERTTSRFLRRKKNALRPVILHEFCGSQELQNREKERSIIKKKKDTSLKKGNSPDLSMHSDSLQSLQKAGVLKGTSLHTSNAALSKVYSASVFV